MAKKSGESQFGDKWDNDGWKEFFHTYWEDDSFVVSMPLNLDCVTLSRKDALAMRDALTKFLEA